MAQRRSLRQRSRSSSRARTGRLSPGRHVELIALGDDLGGGQVEALVKEPHSAPTQYHLDIPWWSFTSPHACTIWVALDDSTPENGCLYFLPGSHQLRLTALGDLGPDLGALFATHPRGSEAADPLPAARWGLLVPLRPHDPWRGREHDAGVTAARSPPRSCPPTSASTAVATSASSATSTSTLTDVYPRR
ncbi:MAG: phytanoyl-CoA dioxygenase family protein [Actinobacteria bacterium]|nr:phytanoyl-CoA dioxygenase family protein [Actinomycetota bacterium]